ncbi:hypothetical protein K439DRAFT_441666 [Ramaria rubella]|nr:hypothetical protein K439DRAFT_441666 [Ramaria rubella]
MVDFLERVELICKDTVPLTSFPLIIQITSGNGQSIICENFYEGTHMISWISGGSADMVFVREERRGGVSDGIVRGLKIPGPISSEESEQRNVLTRFPSHSFQRRRFSPGAINLPEFGRSSVLMSRIHSQDT